ncbi:MAG: hypothetical protein ACFFG0_55680 [Candidatus Thorarchaeota archaeon]
MNKTIFIDQITSSPTECDGFYTWEIPYNISEGNNYRIKIINQDNPLLNNISDFFTIYVVTPPIIIIQEPDNYSTTSQSTPIFNINVIDPNLDSIW